MVEAAKEIRRSVRNIDLFYIGTEVRICSPPAEWIRRCSQPELRHLRVSTAVKRREGRTIYQRRVRTPRSVSSDDCNGDDPLNEITHREREVLYWVSHGLSNKEISERMYLSEKTIKNHVSSILRKLDLDDRTKAAAFAWKEGLPLLPEDFFSQPKMN